MLQEHLIDIGELSLNCAEGPPGGPPLVLLHGIPGCWQEFLPLLPALSQRWHIYALDLRGHGRSGRVPGSYLPRHYIADISAFLERQLDEPGIVFGMSAGGLIAIGAAAQCPEKVRALIVGDSPVDMEALAAWMESDWFAPYFTTIQTLAGSGQPVSEIARILGELPGPQKSATELLAYARTISALDPDMLAYHATGRGKAFLEGIDMDDTLGHIPCPVLLLRADPELGALLTPDAAAHALSVLPDGMQIVLDGAEHDLGLSTWDVAPLLRVVNDFLE